MAYPHRFLDAPLRLFGIVVAMCDGRVFDGDCAVWVQDSPDGEPALDASTTRKCAAEFLDLGARWEGARPSLFGAKVCSWVGTLLLCSDELIRFLSRNPLQPPAFENDDVPFVWRFRRIHFLCCVFGCLPGRRRGRLLSAATWIPGVTLAIHGVM